MDAQISTRTGALPDRSGWFAAGGVFGALLVSACCVAPLLFVLIGVSGAWIANLTALEPYKPYFAALALGFIGLGYWHVYFRARPDCAGENWCATPRPSIAIKAALWIATALVAVSLTTDWWAPYFY